MVWGVLLTLLLSATTAGLADGPAGAATVRGFNGKTITIGGMWATSYFAGAQVGALAYINQINKTNYLHGIKLKFAGYVNDNLDPATALSGVRQLVNQYGVFAIVPDLSAVNPGTYLKSQKILYVGGGFDGSYCSNKVTTSLWGYAATGCLVPSNPPVMPNTYAQYYGYVKAKTGTSHPTDAIFSGDVASGATSVKLATVSAKGAGFKVVYAKANLPVAASDYTPYVQQLMTANHGKQPQAISCQGTTQCVPMWTALKNAGYVGSYWSPLGPVAALNTSMQGTVTLASYNVSPSVALTGMQNAMSAVAPGTQLTGYSNVPAYFDTAMFATAVHTVQARRTGDHPGQRPKCTVDNQVGHSGPGGSYLVPGVHSGRYPLLLRTRRLHWWRHQAGLSLLLQFQGLQGHPGRRKGGLSGSWQMAAVDAARLERFFARWMTPTGVLLIVATHRGMAVDHPVDAGTGQAEGAPTGEWQLAGDLVVPAGS